jgi:hypothetical protein
MTTMPKRKLSITVDSKLIKWIDEQIKKKSLVHVAMLLNIVSIL